MDSESIFEVEEDSKKWSIADIKLLITNRLEVENDFVGGRRSKSVLWGIILRNIKETRPDFEFSREQIMKKFSNLLATFHKIKKRNKKTGQSSTLWIFYDMFNEVYGTSYTIEPPPNTLIQTLFSEEEDVNDEEHESTSTPKRAKRNDVYDLIKAENEKTEQRHKDLLEIEKTNIEIERAKLQTLLDLKDILKKSLVEK